MEDREALGLWEVDDDRLPCLVAKVAATGAPGDEGGGDPGPEPGVCPYSLWCCRCARAEGRLPREDRIRDLERQRHFFFFFFLNCCGRIKQDLHQARKILTLWKRCAAGQFQWSRLYLSVKTK